MGFVARWLVTFLAVLLLGYLRFFVAYDSLEAAAVFALVLGLLNAFIRPILLLLTLPLTIITLGLFALVVNLIVFALADSLVPGVTTTGGVVGLALAAAAVSIVSGLLGRVSGIA